MVDIGFCAYLESFDHALRTKYLFTLHRFGTGDRHETNRRPLCLKRSLCASGHARADRRTLAQQAPQGRKKRVAVFDFDYATVRTSTAALFGTDIDIGKGIADLLVKNLVTDGTYSVIERKALDKILAEQNFSNSDRANPASAAKIGKILGPRRHHRGQHHRVWK